MHGLSTIQYRNLPKAERLAHARKQVAAITDKTPEIPAKFWRAEVEALSK